jgi:hypothetical protein
MRETVLFPIRIQTGFIIVRTLGISCSSHRKASIYLWYRFVQAHSELAAKKVVKIHRAVKSGTPRAYK